MKNNIGLYITQEFPNDDSVMIVEWLKSSGEVIEIDEEIVLVETSKTAISIKSQHKGYVHFRAEPGDKLCIGELFAIVSDGENLSEADWSSLAKKVNSLDESKNRFTRKALKLIDTLALSVDLFVGLDRVTVEDVERINGGLLEKDKDLYRRDKLSFTKISEIKNIDHYNKAVTSSSIVVPIELDPIRKLILLVDEKHHISLSIGDVVIHACSHALEKYSNLNGYYLGNGEVAHYKNINLGYALNLNNNGLTVPNIKNANKKKLVEIATEIKGLSMDYLRGSLKIDDLIGGTFTVSDLSRLNVSSFTPVLFKNQSAILGICSEDKHTDRFNLNLTFDHRLSDGMEAANFINEIVLSINSSLDAKI